MILGPLGRMKYAYGMSNVGTWIPVISMRLTFYGRRLVHP